ncbi:hypothetical protein BaRGS_00038999, partial [Batillaria attramentaria]
SVNTAMAITDLDESVRGLCVKLEDLTTQDIECLKGFKLPHCTQFVRWLKSSMKDGLRELNVFVDLALMSAGEDTINVASVNCFHAAATGYAPLVFTKIRDGDHLLQQCRQVFRSVHADPDLPEKLRVTSQRLDWFKDVQRSHGSVEKTSIAQVASINARGVFKICSDVRTVIELDVSKDKNEASSSDRHYTYDELLDLQSRLVLVAGQAEQGKENVDRFIRIMDGLVRLGKTYIQLCSDGCVLFLDWAVRFLCDNTRPVCCTAEFSGHDMLKGQRDDNDVEDYIAGIATFLERCHKEWLEYVDKKRQEYPDLNMYTVEQLVFLQQQLVKFKAAERNRLLYPMLSLLKEDCTPRDLEEVLEEAMEEVNRMKEQQRGQQKEMEEQEDKKRENRENATVFVDQMKTFGFSTSLALRAMEDVGATEIAKDKRVFDRSLPGEFKPGTPNLMLCRKGEVLNAVTYMYMFPESSDAPLPQPDEVLLCTENTTYEQVDIFLRRAFFGDKKKVYCLAFADSLNYDVGEKIEKKIKEYDSKTEVKDYRLVVVCTLEKQQRAHIVAALLRYVRPSPPVIGSDEVRQYLAGRFAGIIKKDGVQSASSLDPESLCVRVVRSKRSGVGKTLYKRRLGEKLKKKHPKATRDVSVSIPLHCRVANTPDIAAMLLEHTLDPEHVLPRVMHIDISYQVQEGVDHLLYNLLVLGCVTDHHGKVWLRSPMDIYLVETMPLFDQLCAVLVATRQFGDTEKSRKISSEIYQLPYLYLKALDRKEVPRKYDRKRRPLVGSKEQCLTTLLRYCGVRNPSWSELTQFVRFFNKQLLDFENSVFCGEATSEDLPGFSSFVLHLLIQMSRDFATRSLNVSEESLAALVTKDTDDTDIGKYQMKRTWENSPHPYIFFNPDGHTMTFLGFSIDRRTGDLCDQLTKKVLLKAVMTRDLYYGLADNGAPVKDDFDKLPREDRLLRLYRVLGLKDDEMFDKDGKIYDPDDTYELTTDNVKKILAIYMRFRCDIPVIVMGETGCGKTRLIKFLCALQTPDRENIETMVLVKVVRKAEETARENSAAFKHRPLYTVLFFDEANTTEAVGAIKEVMCDGTMAGKPISLDKSLKLVAACNPYRKHSEEMIQRLENAGLGYHVDADKTTDKLGRVPMRHLVYRVQPLPQSMLPQVWDFGQLDARMEELYIRQMARTNQLGNLDKRGSDVLCTILMKSQEFMRRLKNECSFVSLRDVERTLNVLSWFLRESESNKVLFQQLEKKMQSPSSKPAAGFRDSEDSFTSHSSDDECGEIQVTLRETKALVLALAICYRAGLCSKNWFDGHIVPFFEPPFSLPGQKAMFQKIIDRCQDVFLDNVRLEENIARNQALKDNVFMMVVCIELRIPLFLVGKPGSSKSLAKTIVLDAMQGTLSQGKLFRKLKQVHMTSFQCSPLATADGIQTTFRQCSQLQENKNTETFVSVVVLDEVGLAEDSPKMALKTLHPLLEEGCDDEKIPEACKKVAFVGISNWALDPAKMNRGILVQRDVPDMVELKETAKQICATQNEVAEQKVNTLIPLLAEAYLKIFEEARKIREFFGLRDFYSLVKMVYAYAAKNMDTPSRLQLTAAIKRNFGGLETIEPIGFFGEVFQRNLSAKKDRHDDPDCSASGLIKEALSDATSSDTRYLLLLTENYGGLSILLENLLARRQVVHIFGSSFPKDQEYTKICCNINRIKVCMETGQTVILLNLENLYESLYDALNQYYSYYGGLRFVDLGLGTHRVKCRVHLKFRLIVVAEKQVVYEKFPIPLINRLEKHVLTLSSIMTKEQVGISDDLQTWTAECVKSGLSANVPHRNAQPSENHQTEGDVFMGYHPETAPAVVLKAWEMCPSAENTDTHSQVLKESQRLLLWCATPDAAVRTLASEWSRVYHEEQQHEHLAQYLQTCLARVPKCRIMAQVTTHSKLLTDRKEKQDLAKQLPVASVTHLSLQAFDTEQQFNQRLRLFFSDKEEGDKLLIVQCDSGDMHQDLIKCAQYCIKDHLPADTMFHHVVFIVHLPRVAGACFTGFLGGNWHCLHIDELRAPEIPLPPTSSLQKLTPATLFRPPDSVMEADIIPDEVDVPATACNESDTEGDTDAAQTEDIRPELRPEMKGAQEPGGEERDDGSELVRTQERNTPLGPDATQDQQHSVSPEEGQEVEEVENGELDVESLGARETGLDKKQEDDEDVSSNPDDTAEPKAELDSEESEDEFDRYPGDALNMPIQTDEEFEEVDRFRPKFVQQMLTSCVQAAVALVGKDTTEGIERATRRITIMLKLFNENDRFCEGVHKTVWGILDEKEKHTFQADSWLKKEAAKLESVKRAGTFRRSWIVYLENVITPVLASVIAFLDTSANLEHLYPGREEQPESSWKKRLWLNVLQNVCHVTCRQTCLPSVSKGLKEFTVQTPGCGSDILKQAGNFVEHTPLGRCLSATAAGKNAAEMFRCYLMCRCMEKGINQSGTNLIGLGAGQGLVFLHMLLEAMKPRLQAILDMDDHRPNAIRDLLSMAEGDNASDLLTDEDEMTEDVAMLTLLVEELQPTQKQFDDKEGRDEWTDKYNRVAPIITRIFSSVNTAATAPGVSQPEEVDYADGRTPSTATTFPFGDRCQQQLAVLRDGPELTRKALKLIKLQMLWKFLERVQEDPSQKQAKTLHCVDVFLKHANTSMIKGLLGEVTQCMFCKAKLDSAPLELPCKHRLCTKCFIDFCPEKQAGECPQCHEPVPVGFDPEDCEYSDAEEQLKRYQRQVSGFLMALASQVCFSGQEPPEEEAIKHIIDRYIMHSDSKGKALLQTKNMILQDDVVDPTPVFRSFVLRLLLKYRERDVKVLLNDELLKKYQQVIEQKSQHTSQALVQLNLLVIFCIEDQYHEQESLRDDGQADVNNEVWVLSVADMARGLQRHLHGPPMELSTLEALGCLRYVLAAFARVVYDVVQNPSLADRDYLKNLFSEVKVLNEKLCREYGSQTYTDLSKLAIEELRWTLLEDAQTEEGPDRYLVCGKMYKSVRDGVAQILWGTGDEQRLRLLENQDLPPSQKDVFLLLAIHREITMSNVLQIPKQHPEQMVSVLMTLIRDREAVQPKELCQKLVENTLAPDASPLCVKEGQDMATQSLVCLLTHFYLAVRNTVEGSPLLRPLETLIVRPNSMASAYLPTMPQDDFLEVMKVMSEIDKNVYGTYYDPTLGPRWYQIGDCGRAVAGNAKCNECGRKIGGRGYDKPVTGNTVDQEMTDDTKTGYILQAAATRGLEALPERKLAPTECAIIRFFTHAALYLGACVQKKAKQISAMIHPNVPAADVCQFFWDHMKRDMEVLQKAIAHSVDDVYLLLHAVCHRMASEQSAGNEVLLESKEEREAWEEQLAAMFVTPVTQDIGKILVESNDEILHDKRQGENQLLKLVYEVEEQSMEEANSVEQLHTSPAVWCYRPRITIDHFFREFQSQVEARADMKDKLQIIRLFKAESHVLRALHYIPAILVGLKRVTTQLHRRLDRFEATNLLIKQLIEKEECDGLDQLLTHFSRAWDIVKERLITHKCRAPGEGFVSLPEEYHNTSITADSPVAVLLPATRGPGLCSYILLQYLLAAHNDFMIKYCQIQKESEADHTNRYKHLPEVDVRKISARHLVGYSPEGILPMVLSSCNYSFKLGQTTTMEYDFEGFQKQLVDMVLQCKSRVQEDEEGYFPVEMMVYRADTSSSRLFKSVREKIGQEALTPAERRQIRHDLRGNLPDICQSIDNLNTALDFLKSLGGNQDYLLRDFMVESLQMENDSIHSSKDAFDEQEKALCEPLTADQKKGLKAMCDMMSADRLELLLLHLFECIMLRLSQPPDEEFCVDPADFELYDELTTSLRDAPFYEKEPVEVQTGLLTAADLDNYKFPKSLKGRHSTNAWLTCRRHLAAKRREQKCAFSKAHCEVRSLHVSYVGNCTGSPTVSSSTHSPGSAASYAFFCQSLAQQACGTDLQIVCGSDGVTYNNLCLFEKARCNNIALAIADYQACPN